MAPTQPCPLCGNMVPASESARYQSAVIWSVKCRTCGEFLIDNELMLGGWPQEMKDKRYHLSALTKRSKTRMLVNREMLDRLFRGQLVDPPVLQKVETVLRWVADQSNEFGQGVKVNAVHDYPIATCVSDREFRAILDAAIQLGYLGGTTDEVVVSFKGWGHLAERTNVLSSAAFIAMHFDGRLEPVREAISKAIVMAGYRPVRVDEEEYIGGVMDKVVALIRDSRFVVADFTNNRGGVYYEAGFALGMGITVIPVCDHAQLESTAREVRLHFDVQHLNFLDWNIGELAAFSEKLKNRVLAILGRGPLPLP